MAVNKITGFHAPYKSDTFRDIVDSLEGASGLLDIDGPITQAGPTITLPAFRVVQDGLIVEKTVATALSEPSLTAPYYLVVTAPTPNDIDDLIFTFAKTPEDISANEVLVGAYDGFEWRAADKLSIKGVYDLIAQTNIDTLNIGPFSGLRTSLNGGNYDNSPGTLVDQQGQTQRFEEIASFPVVAADPDWQRIDRILYRRPTDSINRVGLREFLLGGTYSTSPASLTPVESFDDTAVRQTQKVLIASDNTAHVFSVSGSGTNFQLDYTKISSDRLSALIAPTTLFTGFNSKTIGVALDSSDNFHVVYVKSGNICYRKFSSIAGVLVGETIIDTQSGACASPAISIDPASTRVFVVYQSLLGPSNNQIFFTSRTLGGGLVTSPKNIASSAQNLITPDIFVSEDLFVYVTWENDTLGSILYRRFDDLGDPLDASATTVSTGVEQIGVGTLTGNAKDPRVLVTGNREVIVAFRQDKGSSIYGLSVYTRGAAFMQELTGPAEDFESFDIVTDPIFNSLMFTAVQASSVDFIKVYDQTVSFVLNLAASGSRAVAVARDRLGSLLHVVASEAAGTYTSYDAVTSIIAFGAASVIGGVSTINIGANQFLVTAISLSQAPDIDDQVVITGSGVGGNNSTRLITFVELMSLDAVDDVYRVTVSNNFTATEDPSTANGDFQTPDGNNAAYVKSVSEALDHVFSLFELGSDILLSRMVAPGTTILNWLPANSAGSISDFLVLHGSGSVDWESTSAGNLTLTGTVKVTNIFTSSVFTLTPGSYPMVEGDALYVVVDDSDLTPTPQVTSIATLPWNEPIGVLGIIANGVFEPAMPNLRPLSSTEEFVLGESLPTYLKARLGINSDVSYDAYTSTEHINAVDNYPEAISNLDTAVQNIIGQIFMTPESPVSQRVAVSGVDKTLLKGSIFGAKYKEHLIDFAGAVINFQTGVVYEEDGTTPLGVNFTPVIPAAGTWRWFAVNLLPGSVGSDNRLSLQLKITAASADGASQAAAPRATFAGGPDVGQVAVFSSDGANITNIDYSNLLNLVTNFSTSEASPGSDSSEILVSGNISIDWESTTPGEFTFASGLRVQDLVANVTWLPVAGGYAMTEGDALYILLDTAALTPTPQVTPVASLPFTSNIYVIGVIRDGYFVPTSQSLKTLESGENWSLGDNLSNEQASRLGLSGNIGYTSYPSTKSISDAQDYATAIGYLDLAIKNILEQISLKPKSPTSSRVIVTGVDKTLFETSVRGLQIKDYLIAFEGAEIDFETGDVYESDGITPLGTNFTPVVPAAGNYRWFAVNIKAGVVGADNRISLTLIVTAATSDGTSLSLAPVAKFKKDPKVGQVAVFSAGGVNIDPIDYPQIINVGASSGSGGGGLFPQYVNTGGTVEDGIHYQTDTTSGGFTLLLPEGADGSVVMFSDTARTWHLNQLTITPATGEEIDGLLPDESLVCDVRGGWIELSWNTTSGFWSVRTFALTLTEVATATQAGIVSTGPQVFGGQKDFSGGLTVSGGSAANSGLWTTANVFHMRGGTSGLSIDNTSAVSIAGATDAGAWTFGPSAGAALTHVLQSGNQTVVELRAGGATAANRAILNFYNGAGTYIGGIQTKVSTSDLEINQADASSALFFRNGAGFVNGSVTYGGLWVFGQTAGLGTSGSAYHLAYGSTVSRMTSSAGSGAFSGRTALFVGANEYLDAAGTQKAITTGGATWAEFTTSIAADATLIFALKTNLTSQSADVALSGTNRTMFSITAGSTFTYGVDGTSLLQTLNSGHTLAGSIVRRETRIRNTSTGVGGGDAHEFNALLSNPTAVVAFSGNVAPSSDSGSEPILQLRAIAATADNFAGATTVSTRPILAVYNNTTRIALATAIGAWTFGATAADYKSAQPHAIRGAINSDATGTSDGQKGLLINNNSYLSAYSGIINTRTTGLTGGMFIMEARTSNTATTFEWRTNVIADGPTGANTQVGSITAAGAWSLGPSSAADIEHTIRGGPSTQNVLTLNNNAASPTYSQIRLQLAGATKGYWGVSATNAFQVVNAAGTNFIAEGADAGNWIFGLGGVNQTHTIQGKTVILKLSAAGGGDVAAFDFYTNNAARARISTDNSAGLTFYKSDLSTAVGSFTNAGVWTLGATATRENLHLLYGKFHTFYTDAVTAATIESGIFVSTSTGATTVLTQGGAPDSGTSTVIRLRVTAMQAGANPTITDYFATVKGGTPTRAVSAGTAIFTGDTTAGTFAWSGANLQYTRGGSVDSWSVEITIVKRKNNTADTYTIS